MPKVLLFSLLLVLSVPSGAQANDPFAKVKTVALTAADEYMVGREYMEMYTRGEKLVEDPELNARVNEIAQRMISSSERPGMVFKIVILDKPSLNAAALPGGFMFVHKGLLDAMTWEEVAFVIGHEISHVQLRHFATSLNMQRAVQVVDASKLSDDPENRHEAMRELNRMMTRYARNLELESDLYGLLFAMRAGYPGHAGIGAMEKMRSVMGEIPPQFAEHSSHPTFSQRIDQITKGQSTITDAHDAFAAGVAFAQSGNHEAAASSFEHYLQLFPGSPNGWNNLGMCYLQAAIASQPDDSWHDNLSLYLASDITVRGLDQVALGKARHALAKALELDGQRDAALANMGVLARVAGEFEEAERYLKLALGLDPGYGAYMNNLGNVYAAQGKLKLAESWYQKALSKDPTNLRAKANRALSLTLRKKKKAAIALWRELEDEPRFAKQAHDQLVALGAKAPGTKPAPKDSPAAPSASAFVTTGRGPESKEVEIKLGGSLSELVELLGEPDHKAVKEEGFTQVLFWRTLGVAVVYEDDEAFNVLVRSPARLDLGGQLGLGATGAEVEAAFGAPQEKISKLGGRHEEWVYGPSLQLAVDGAKQVVLGAQLALE